MDILLEQLNLRLDDASRTLQRLSSAVDARGPHSLTWNEMLDALAVLETKITSIGRILAAEHLPAEQREKLVLHNQVLVPHLLTTDPSDELQTATQGRIATFTHETVPALLQTKHLLEVERRDAATAAQAKDMSLQQANDAIDALNRHCDTALAALDAKRRTFEAKYLPARLGPAAPAATGAPGVPPKKNNSLAAAVYMGEGLRPA